MPMGTMPIGTMPIETMPMGTMPIGTMSIGTMPVASLATLARRSTPTPLGVGLRLGIAVPQVAETGVVAQQLFVEPAVDDAAAEAPLLAELDRGNALLLGPLVDGLRLEPQVVSHFLDGED